MVEEGVGDDVASDDSGDVPEDARTIVVPLSNPDTAADLLTIAAAVAAHDGGRVIGLVVVVDGDEDATEAARHGELADVVASVDQAHTGAEIVLQAHAALSVTRGILDRIRESRADMVVLGVGERDDGPIGLGPIALSVLETAACDVVVFRPSYRGRLSNLRGVVVAAQEDDHDARSTARVGHQLSGGLGLPMELVHVLAPGIPTHFGRAHLHEVLDDVGIVGGARRTVIHGTDPSEAVLARLSDRDLLITGLPPRDERREQVLYGVCQELFEGARGPVIGIGRNRPTSGLGNRVRRWQRWLHPELTSAEQETVVWQSQRNAAPTLDFLILRMVSATLASLGLLLDSSAVIIGAMLVAPLMGPLIASAVGITTARAGIASRAWGTVLAGALAAAVLAVLTGLLGGVETATVEMLARGSPSLLDAAVALASGVAGAYATARKDIPAALAGVAIAAALVPPLCVSALGLVVGDGSLALGALLLFLTNIICIAGMASVVFWWLGMRPTDQTAGGRRWVPLLTIAVLSALIAVVVFDVSEGYSNDGRTTALLQEVLLEDEVVDVSTQGVAPARVVVTVRGEEPPTEAELVEMRRIVDAEYETDADLQVVFQQVLPLP